MTPRSSREAWLSFLDAHPDAHLLQSAPWGDLKAAYGWAVERIQFGSAGAQVLLRHLPLGLRLAYVPKGPVGEWLPDLLPHLDEVCRRHRAFALKVEPDSVESPDIAARLADHGFVPSPHAVQPRRTLIVDLRREEDEILAAMSQKTRYNVRLASRKGVSVHPWDDLAAFGRMIQETAVRDRFGAHTPAYYRRAYELFRPLEACELLVAELEGQPLAALMVFRRGERAWYFYGASTSEKRNTMPTYLLQWEAMRRARQQGCTHYDLWGVPDHDLETLEAGFIQRSDGLWGVYRFKRGFGGRLVRSAGAWDRPYNRVAYALYRRLSSRRERAD